MSPTDSIGHSESRAGSAFTSLLWRTSPKPLSHHPAASGHISRNAGSKQSIWEADHTSVPRGSLTSYATVVPLKIFNLVFFFFGEAPVFGHQMSDIHCKFEFLHCRVGTIIFLFLNTIQV